VAVNREVKARDEVVDRRTQVLEATARVISQRGADGTRLIDVARAAGVSGGLIQHHFDTRDELLAAAFRYFNDLWVSEWESAAAGEADPPHKLTTMLHLASFESPGWEEVQWRIWVEFWSLCNRDESFRPHYATVYERFRRPFRETIAEGMKRGHFSPRYSLEDAVDRITSQIEGLRVHALLEPARMPRARMAELLVQEAQEDLQFG
jgi:AcrR family transcriptional regulator